MKSKEELIKHYIKTTNKKFPNTDYGEGFKDGYLSGLYWVAEIENLTKHNSRKIQSANCNCDCHTYHIDKKYCKCKIRCESEAD